MVHNSVVPASESVTHPTDLDKDSEDLLASPSQPELESTQVKSMALGSRNLSNPNTKDTANDSTLDADEVREAALRRELAGIRSVNEVIEGVVESLERAKGNMETVSRTVTNATALLNTWTRILSQTEHNQRLILNHNWHGASQDISEMERESAVKRQEKERRELEEAQRREVNARKLEEDERRREEAAAVRGRGGSKGKTRGSGRGSSGNYGGVGGPGGTNGVAGGGGSTLAPGRAGSGIGRGFGGRGKARGRGIS